MVPGNIEGVEKVEESNGKYAFFMESASIEYLVERRCKLSQVCDDDDYWVYIILIFSGWRPSGQ